MHLTCISLAGFWNAGKVAVATRSANIDKVFKALADPGRRYLLDLLHRKNGQTLSELCAHMEMTRQAVTQHLQQLEHANLVAVVWEGREKLHYLNPVPFARDPSTLDRKVRAQPSRRIARS